MRNWVRNVGQCGVAALAGVSLTGCPSMYGNSDDMLPTGWELARELDESDGALLSVWGEEPAELRAVGGQISAVGELGVGVVLRRDELGEWTPEPLPPNTPVLNWVHGAEGVVWAVGNGGVALRLERDVWVRNDTQIDVPLWGVWVVSAYEAWAVGGNAFEPDLDGVLVHYTAGRWKEVPLPSLPRRASAIFKVWGTSESNVYAVGDNGVIVHYDGNVWSFVESGTQEDLISLWGIGPDEIVAVGGRTSGVMSRFDGTRWTATALALPALNGVWMDSTGDAILAGERGVVSRLPAGTDQPETVETPQRLEVLHAAFAFDDGLQLSVGGTLQAAPPYTGIILEGMVAPP